MRYMKGVNEWLERDVRNRREEFRDVFQTVQDLRRQIMGMRKKGRGNRDRDTRRTEEVRRTPSSRTRPETTMRMDMPQSSSGTQVPTTPVGPQPQRWTAVPALIQPYPQQQRTPVARDNSSRAGGSRVPFVPPTTTTTRMQAQPTIILLPQVGGGARVPPPPGQAAAAAAHPSFHPVNWRYPQGREQQRLVERGGTRRSRR